MPKKSRRKMMTVRKRRNQHLLRKERARQKALSESNNTRDAQPSIQDGVTLDSSIVVQQNNVHPQCPQENPDTTYQTSDVANTLDANLSQADSTDSILTQAIVSAGLRKLSCTLPSDWVCSADTKGFYCLCLNSGSVKAIQRQVFVSFSGDPKAYVHCQPSSVLNEVIKYDHTPIKLSLETLDKFCKSIVALVNIVMKYSICVGANHQESKELWSTIPQSVVDPNPYFEPYTSEEQGKTLRSRACSKLVLANSFDIRCKPCTDVIKTLEEKLALSVY